MRTKLQDKLTEIILPVLNWVEEWGSDETKARYIAQQIIEKHLSLLQSERDRLQTELNVAKSLLDMWVEEGCKNKAERDKYRKALEFYANIETWKAKSYDRNSDYYPKAVEDSGDIARTALESSEKEGREVTVEELGQAIIDSEGDIDSVSARLLEVFDIRKRKG